MMRKERPRARSTGRGGGWEKFIRKPIEFPFLETNTLKKKSHHI